MDEAQRLTTEQTARLRAMLDKLPLQTVERRLPAKLTRFRGRTGTWRTSDYYDLFDLTIWDGVTKGALGGGEKPYSHIKLFAIADNHVVTECNADLVSGETQASQRGGTINRQGTATDAYNLLMNVLNQVTTKG
jgi:hypothetical protein